MANKVLNKIWGIIGLEDDDYEEIEEVEEDAVDTIDEIEQPQVKSKKQSKVVNIHTATDAKVMIIKPRDYSESTYICDNLKSRKIMLLNTTELEPKVAQRLVDFLCGSTYALGGDLQEVEKGVYILTPSNVSVSNELKNELSTKGMFNWSR